MIGLKRATIFAIFSCIIHLNLLVAADVPTTLPPNTTTTVKPTPLPTTVPTSPPTTKAPPTPPKFPQNIGSWKVENQQQNVTCVIFKSAIQIDISYTSLNKSQVANLDVPETATAEGDCGSSGSVEQTLVLTWPVTLQDKTTKDSKVTLFFHKEQLTGGGSNVGAVQYSYAIRDITVALYKDEANFPNATEPLVPLTDALGDKVLKYMTPIENSYSCQSENELKSERNSTFLVKFKSLQFQAFATNHFNHTEFSSGVPCPEDAMDIVAFSAGVIFGIIVLVLIVLGLVMGVLYFVKKSRAANNRAYENM